MIHAGMNKLYESGVVGGFNPNEWARRATGIIIMAGMIALCFVRLTSPGRLLRLAMWAPAGLFLLIPTQFPWYFVWCLPMLAVAPSPAILLYVALLPLYHLQYEYPWLLWVEHAPVWLMLLVGAFLRTGRESGEPPAGETIDR